LTKDEQKQKLDKFDALATRCACHQELAFMGLNVDAEEQAAIIAAGDFIKRIRQGGKRGGSASSAAKTDANRENAKRKRTRKPKGLAAA
jgi:hypothetical protein